MAFDGIITRAAAAELSAKLADGKIDKIYEPEPDSIVINIHRGREQMRLFASCQSAGASVRLITSNPENPKEPFPFCMLLRKHIQGSRIVSIEQVGTERIIEFTLERLNELGLMVSKKLIFEIMGKYSNIILVDMGGVPAGRSLHDAGGSSAGESSSKSAASGPSADVSDWHSYGSSAGGKILGSIKGVPSGINRVREILPGRLYEYPPVQDKIPFDKAGEEDFECAGSTGKEILSAIGGISPAVAEEFASLDTVSDRMKLIDETLESIENSTFTPRVYEDEAGIPREFHIVRLSEYEGCGKIIEFSTLSECMDYFFENRESTSRIIQRSNALLRPAKAALEKLELKKQRLLEDLLRAEDSDRYRLYGELLTANLGKIVQGMKEIRVVNYYDGSEVIIPIDPRWSPSKNAQSYYKRYSKAKTAVTEKKKQLDDTENNIDYLESSITFIENAKTIAGLEELQAELEDTGFIRRRRTKGQKPPRFKAAPKEYVTSDGFTVLVGRNNRENDVLTLEIASKGDYWLHTKDIPGSHVIMRTQGREISEQAIYEAAALAALNSKAKNSENVPVDYVPVRYVKKPSGAKPGKVIFTHNRTVYVDPGEPGGKANK